jgi:hypothetical protein
MRGLSGVGQRPSVAATAALIVVTALLVAGCTEPGPPGILVVVSNRSANDVLVRAHLGDGEVHVLRAPAHTDVEMRDALADVPPPTIDILHADCGVVGSWPMPTGGKITIDPRGSASLGPIPPDEPGDLLMDEVAACGNTQLPGGSPGPTPSPSGG